jgi:hypothetical protein
MLYDRAEIKGSSARITKDGYFVAEALVARADNIQSYRAHELGLTDRDPQDVVRVFRPAEEVFSRDAMASLAHRPVTLDHPADNVSAENWKDLAVGDVGDEVVRDGEFVRVPLKIMDAKAIDSIKSDRREFSLGYSIVLDMTPGEHDGEAFDAVARDLRYNHLAAVKAARGGADLRIIDERTYEQIGDGGISPPVKSAPGESHVATKTITFDGLPLEVTDAAEAAITKLQGQVKDAVTAKDAAETALATAKSEHDKALAAKDAEIDDLKAKVIDQAAIDRLADAKADVVAKAKAVCGDKLGETAGKTVAEVRRMACDAAGIDVADKSDDYIEARFDALTKDAKPADKLGDAIKDGVVAKTTDAEVNQAYDAMVSELADAWKKPNPAIAA